MFILYLYDSDNFAIKKLSFNTVQRPLFLMNDGYSQ